MPAGLGVVGVFGASLAPLIKLLVEELNEVREFRFQRQLRSLERELRLMLAVLDHVDSSDKPDEAMKVWAENAREVVRSVEDMIDSFMFERAKTSGAKTLKRPALFFNEIFLGYMLIPNVKHLLLRINDLSKKSKVLNIRKDGGGEESKDGGGEGDGESSNSPSPNFQIINKEKYPKIPLKFRNRGLLRSPVIFSFGFQLIIDPVTGFPAIVLQVMKSQIYLIYDLLRVRHQILNVRKHRGDSEELEVTVSREENAILASKTIISSFLDQIDSIDSVLSQKFLLYPFATCELKQVKQCLSDLLKHMEAVGELDEREKVWWEWVREICITAKDFLTSFISKREEQIETLAKLKAPTLLLRAGGAILKATTFLHADSELRTQMMVMRSRIQYAYGRRWIYGMGEFDEKRQGLTPSKGFELESILKESKLLRALSNDVKGMKDRGERGMAWLMQMKDLDREVDNFSNRILQKQEKMKGRSPLLFFKKLFSIAKEMEEMSIKFYVMSERKITYDIGKFEGKRGQDSQSQDRQGTTASISGTTVEDDDNNMEEGQPASSQQHTKATKYVSEIEEIGNNYDIGKFEGKRGQDSQIQDRQGTTASISGTTVEDDDNNMEEGQPASSQQHTKATKYVSEIEEIGNNYDIGKFVGKRGQDSQIQDRQGTTASISGTTVEDDNNMEEGQPGSSQQHTKATRSVSEIEEFGKNYDNGKFEGKMGQDSQIQDRQGTTASFSGTTVRRSYAKEQVESIKRELELINAFLKDVEAIEEPDARLNYWEEEMREIAHEAEDIIGIYEKPSPERKSIFTRLASLINWNADFKVVREISIINEKIMKFTHRRIAYGIEHVEEPNSGTRRIYKRSSPSQRSEESVVIGFDDQVNKIKEILLADDKPNLCVISIVGIEGSGKTALARSIYDGNSADFDIHTWVSISEKRSAEEILEKIWKKLNGGQSIKEELRGKRYLIVLDNFSMAGSWNDVKVAFPDESNRSRIVITTRDMAITPHSDSRIFPYNLHLLSTDESWKLFTNTSQMEVPPKQEKLLREMVRSCGGLPLAIVEMGELLSRKVTNNLTDVEWSTVLDELKEDKEKSEISGKGPWSEISDKVSRELPLELIECLNYFLLFPEGFDIPARRLITLWIAEGFLRLGRGDDSPEQFAERYLMELIDQNMVQATEKKPNGKVRSCCLPVALRKLLLKAIDKVSKGQVNTTSKSSSSYKVFKGQVTTTSKSSSSVRLNCGLFLLADLSKLVSKAMKDKFFKGQVNTASKSSSSLQQIRRIVDHYNDTEPSHTSFNHIHGDNTDVATLQASYRKPLSFMSFDYREGSQPGDEIGNFLQRCISGRCLLLLRVLDLERVFRPQLPKVLSKLVLLRYLGLRWTYLESLPSSISNLLKLQTLDVKHTYISTLPRSIWKMQRLRHLYLSENYRSRFGPRPRGVSLTDLQTLWGAFVDEKSPVKGGLDTLINLRKLGVACRCMSNQKDEMSLQLEAVAEWIQKLVHLQSLRLKSHDENNQPWDLHLKSLLLLTNLSSVYFLGRLKTPSVISEFPENLIEITLSASALSEDPMQKLYKLPKLRILQLFSESYVGKNMCCPENSFPQLRVLKLWKLEELKDWIVLGGALPRLRDLEIRSCAKLHKLPDGLQHVKTLQELILSNMPTEFTERIKDCDSEDWGKIAHVRHVSIEP